MSGCSVQRHPGVLKPSARPASGGAKMGSLDATASSESYLEDALQDAERLLKFAAEVGVDVDPGVRHSIVQARTSSGGVWNDEAATGLLTALTTLAAELNPVTA